MAKGYLLFITLPTLAGAMASRETIAPLGIRPMRSKQVFLVSPLLAVRNPS